MRDAEFVGTTEVALALGVSVSTVKRWMDRGLLPGERSAGRHRRLRGHEVARAVQRRGLPFVDLERLTRVARPPQGAALRRHLFGALRRGDERRVRQLLLMTSQRGMPMPSMSDDLIAPVMKAVGHSWETGLLGVSDEHRATQLCASALYQIKATLNERRTQRRPVALGGGPEGDPYVLATVLAEMVLLEEGWDAVNLGPNTPLSALAVAIDRWQPKLVWLSVSHIQNAEAFVNSYRALHRVARRRRAAIIVGGRGLTAELRGALRADASGDTMAELVRYARSVACR